MKLRKRKGYAMLVNLLIVVMVMGTISSTLAMQQSAYFTNLESGRTALQAQQIAAAKANEISVFSYSDAQKTAETRAAMTGTDFEREVLVGPEVDLGSNNKKREITVNVYKPGESQARFSLSVTLTSQGSSLEGSLTDNGWTKLPNGLIIQWARFNHSGGPAIVTFPIAFPNKCFSVNANLVRSTLLSNSYAYIYNVSRTGAGITVPGEAGSGYYMAIGY